VTTDDSSGGVPNERQPSAKVLGELQAAFGTGDTTRVMSDTELNAVPDAAQRAAATDASGAAAPNDHNHDHDHDHDHLVAESTRRARRRSRREAKREAKRESRRLAEARKQEKKAAKRAAKAAKKANRGRKSRRQPEIEVETLPELSDAAVRIIPGPGPATTEPSVHAASGRGDASPPAAPPPDRETIAIADDGMPDPVYVEGDLGSGGSAEVVTTAGGDDRATVFIDDRGTGDVVPIDVATSAARMEPRLRERRLAVKRSANRKRLKWAAVAIAAVGLVVGGLAVLGSSWFEITHIDVEGAVYSQGDDFDAVIDFLDGANVLRVDTDRAEVMLEAIPWVADARVTTDFPHSATIEIRERNPMIAYRGGDGRYRVLDSEGRVLDVLAGRPVDFLELEVSGPPDLQPGQTAPAGYRAAAALVSALTPQMRQHATSVSANQEATELSLMLDEQIEVSFGAAEDLLDKLVRLQTILTNPDPERVPTELIDVSTEDVIIR
jgi:cell division septal protein FtsQ